jgi:hypothetical protein
MLCWMGMSVGGKFWHIGPDVPFGEGHDRGAFVLQDGFVGVDADEEGGAEAARLEGGAGVAWEG